MDNYLDNNTNEFSLKDIFEIIYLNLFTIIVIAAIFGSASFLVTKYYIPEVFEAKAKMIVNRDSTHEKVDTPFSYNDALLTARLVDTYSIILTSDTILQQIINQLNLNITPDGLRGNINASGIKDTDILSISVKDNSPEMAAKIANKLIELAPQEILRTKDIGSVAIIDKAKTPVSPIQPSIPINTAIAALLGAAIFIAYEILKEYLDDTIKTEEQIKNRFGIPVLGTLPEVMMKSEKTK